MPQACRNMLPISGREFVASDGEALVVGSTYEHTYSHLEPTVRAGGHLLEGAISMIPALEGSKVMDAGAAIRVTVPGIRLPMVGPLPGMRRTWIFTGLGSKGLMLAPLLAEELPGYFQDPDSIPKEISVALSRGNR
ncbi:MAG: FAD-dependent oxidoreductase [Bacteroidetes bacterium]|nr:FAD-dependent oxidoreductase [Bacteroidota bacterium]